jgi:hypothetical protein
MKNLRHFSYEIWLKRRDGMCIVSASVLSEQKPPTGFPFICETGNYKYSERLCRGFLRILQKKKFGSEHYLKNVEFFNGRSFTD